METKTVTQLHEYAALILDRIQSMEGLILVHTDNLRTFAGHFPELSQKESNTIDARRRAVARLWKLYNDQLNKIQEITKYNK